MTDFRKKYPLAQSREFKGAFDPEGFRGRAEQVFYGKGQLDPFENPPKDPQYKKPQFELHGDILSYIQLQVFTVENLLYIDQGQHREVARALIYNDIDSAAYVVQNMGKFLGVTLLEIAHMLLTNDPPYPHLIIENEHLFGEDVLKKLNLKK